MFYRFKNCELNTDRVLLKRDGSIERLEPQAFDALVYLISRRGRMVSREELLNRVWGHEHVSESTLSSCIKVIRRAVGDDGSRQEIIRTVHGRGYEFVADLEETDFGEPTTAPDAGRPAAPPRPSSLPAALQSLIGRDELMERVGAALHTHRLITLVGPGGVGKTSLAYELARSVEDEYEDGVLAVELVTVADPGTAIEAIATALRVHPRQGDTLESAILDPLRSRRSLLLLDNCEHLVEPVGGIVDRIMRSAPRVCILATSREPLAVEGERLWPVAPLPLADDAGAEPPLEELTDVPAVRLFVERAVAVDPYFVLDTATAPAVLEICRRLDGLPLAIELAASRARSMDVAEIARRLDERFRLLKKNRPGSDPRHQTLHDTLRWSFELLTPAERQFFADLSVFAGRFDLGAAEAIFGADSGPDIMDLITRLAERSMVAIKRSPSFGLRYELLDSLRAFGRQQLDPEHARELSSRHTRHYTALSIAVEQGLQGDNEAHFVGAAEAAFADLRAAHRHSVDIGDSSRALGLTCAIREYAMRTMRYEALTWADSAVRVTGAGHDPLYPTATAIQAYGAWVRGEFETALEYARRASELEEALRVSPSGLAERVLGNVLYVQGDIEAGFTATSRLLELAEQSGNHSRLGHACYMHSIANSSLGDLAAASGLAERAMRHGRTTGSPTDIASAFVAAGFAARDDAAALDAFVEADRIAGRAGNRWMSHFARTEICGLLVERSEPDRARASLADVVDVWFRAGEWSQQWVTLTRCVVALFAMRDYELTARVIGAIEARSVLGAPPVTPRLRDQAVATVESLRARLGGQRCDELSRDGAGLPISEVVHRVRTALLGRPGG